MKKVVIAGMGDTGVLVATRLAKDFEVTGISTKPCLLSGQELGTRLTAPSQWKKNYLLPYQDFLALDNVNIIHGQLTGISPASNRVAVTSANGDELELAYDALLIATGTTNGFWRNNMVENILEIESSLKKHHEQLTSAQTVAIVGGGPTGVSTAYNLKEKYPHIKLHFFFSRERPLPGYHEKTRDKVNKKLQESGINLHPNTRVSIPDKSSLNRLDTGKVLDENNECLVDADCILWAVGNVTPNNQAIPENMLNPQGFIKVDEYLRVVGHDNIFSVGDIADTDANRSSARNAGFLVAARNIRATLNGKPQKMKAFRAPENRWGSILGVQKDGLTVFTPKGFSMRMSPCFVEKILFPIMVKKWINKGMKNS